METATRSITTADCNTTDCATTDDSTTEYETSTQSVELTSAVTNASTTFQYESTTFQSSTEQPDEFPIIPVAAGAAAGAVLIIIVIVLAILYKRGQLSCTRCQKKPKGQKYRRRPSMPTLQEADGREDLYDYERHVDDEGTEYYTREGKVYFRDEHPDGRIYYRDIPRSEGERKSAAYQYARFRGDEAPSDDQTRSAQVEIDGYKLAKEPEEHYVMIEEADRAQSTSPPRYSQAQQFPSVSTAPGISVGQTNLPVVTKERTNPAHQSKSVSFKVSDLTHQTSTGTQKNSQTLPHKETEISQADRHNRNTYVNFKGPTLESVQKSNPEGIQMDNLEPLYVNQEQYKDALPEYMNKEELDAITEGQIQPIYDNQDDQPTHDNQVSFENQHDQPIYDNQVTNSENQDNQPIYDNNGDRPIYDNYSRPPDNSVMATGYNLGEENRGQIDAETNLHLYGNINVDQEPDEIYENTPKQEQDSGRHQRPQSIFPSEDEPPVKTYIKAGQLDIIQPSQHSDDDDIY